MNEPILTQTPVSIDLSQDAMKYIVSHLSSPVVAVSNQVFIEVDNFCNLLLNLTERGVGKVTVTNNEDLL